MKIRIKFSKHGAVKYIGHLDVMRYFQKAMRRADIDIKYSEGMSPHQIMSFAQPLGVGYESDGEYLDIEVNHTDSSEQSIDQLNQVMADGIRVTEYKKLPDDAKNAMSCITAADYIIQIRTEYKPAFQLEGAIQQMMQQEQISVMKKTKKGEREIDLKPFIYEIRLDHEAELFMKLSAGSENNIKPRYVMETLYQAAGEILPEFALHVIRKELYMELDGELVTLGSIGDLI